MLFVKGLRLFPNVFDAEISPEANSVTIFSEAREAIVEETIYPGTRGRIRCHGVFYRAELYGTDSRILCARQRVRMVGIRENIALVTAWIV